MQRTKELLHIAEDKSQHISKYIVPIHKKTRSLAAKEMPPFLLFFYLAAAAAGLFQPLSCPCRQFKC
jgi:hypothetical protein